MEHFNSQSFENWHDILTAVSPLVCTHHS